MRIGWKVAYEKTRCRRKRAVRMNESLHAYQWDVGRSEDFDCPAVDMMEILRDGILHLSSQHLSPAGKRMTSMEDEV